MEQDLGSRRRRGRTATACLECQRMKKKCDRQWPCNHCQRRRIAHVCDFGASDISSRAKAGAMPSETNPRGPLPEFGVPVTAPTAQSSEANTAFTPNAASAVQALGYVQSELFDSITSSQQPVIDLELLELPGHVVQATRAVPPRPYTDRLVQNFFDMVNHHYGIIHQESFMVAYTAWWPQRGDVRHSRSVAGIATTCLVLRMCANSSQFLPPAAKTQLEFDFGESIDNLSKAYHSAADIISGFLPVGSGGLVNAQQLFLCATWLKAEADFVTAWHSLAACIRHAQEIGISNDYASRDLSYFERDSRRRLWCAAYTWDKFMTVTFHRPPIIQPGDAVPQPSRDVDNTGPDRDIPSAVVPKILESELARYLSEAGQEATLAEMVSFVDTWLLELPSVFAICNPDTRWDSQCARLRFQRLQLHTVGYMTQLMLLRPSVASRPGTADGMMATEERALAVSHIVEVGLKAMAASKAFFDLCFPQQAKYFMVSFCPFDISSLLSSLILHEKGAIPRRREVVAAIGTALYIARRLRGHTKMGNATWTILTSLTESMEFHPDERLLLDEVMTNGEIMTNGGASHDSMMSGPPGRDLMQGHPESNERGVLPGLLQAHNQPQSIDLGVLDGLWDWQGLSLDLMVDSI